MVSIILYLILRFARSSAYHTHNSPSRHISMIICVMDNLVVNAALLRNPHGKGSRAGPGLRIGQT